MPEYRGGAVFIPPEYKRPCWKVNQGEPYLRIKAE
jgi:hypothetical protein